MLLVPVRMKHICSQHSGFLMPGMLLQGHSGVAGGGQVDFADNPGELLQASPSIVLADHGPQADTGRVLSVAPLMGAAAASDAGHARWLHVKVRPPARGLLKAARVTTDPLSTCRMVLCRQVSPVSEHLTTGQRCSGGCMIIGDPFKSLSTLASNLKFLILACTAKLSSEDVDACW